MLKATSSNSMIIPIVIQKTDPIKNIFKQINLYFNDNLQQRGLYYMKDSTKLILSEQNHQIFQCKDEEIFETIYEEPYELLSLTKSKRIDFLETNTTPEPKQIDDFSEEIENCVFKLDNETLAKNLGKPYVFIALK